MLALAWVPVMVAAGVAMMLFSVRDHGGPPFFDLREFLFGNAADLFCFAGLVLTAVAMRGIRHGTGGWMICATAILTGPGFGRLLPTPFLVPWAWIIVGGLTPLIFPLIGVAGDFLRARRVHPAPALGNGRDDLRAFRRGGDRLHAVRRIGDARRGRWNARCRTRFRGTLSPTSLEPARLLGHVRRGQGE